MLHDRCVSSSGLKHTSWLVGRAKSALLEGALLFFYITVDKRFTVQMKDATVCLAVVTQGDLDAAAACLDWITPNESSPVFYHV